MFKRIATLVFFCLTVALIFAENPETRIINTGGFNRKYLLYTPEKENYKTPEGIIVCLHGFSRTMQDFFNEYNFSEIADSLNYIVLAPQALPEQDKALLANAELINLFTSNDISLNSVWACGLEVKAYLPILGINILILNGELNKNVNDVGFITSIIDNTVSEFDLDGRNIFVFGTSMGGYMSYQFALKQGDKLSGLISVAGSMGLKIKAAENPVKVPICDFHSLTDEVVPYLGSHTQSGLWVTLAEDKGKVIDYWVNNNMAGSPVVENVDYYPSTNGITVEKITYPAADYEVIHYKMNGSKHSYFFSKEADCMDYKEEAVKFIQSHASGHQNGILTAQLSAPFFYPNPAHDRIHFETETGNVFVYDLTGKEVFSKTFRDGQLDISFLKSGIYIVHIDAMEKTHVGKLIKF
ncbi:MAG: T9SS type A sorting domain-containing protein [Candidatus Symbiothrix sp.]|nr:T9SS type A sorting domain-containing protein [Candidatus Symbiothrix sp.]